MELELFLVTSPLYLVCLGIPFPKTDGGFLEFILTTEFASLSYNRSKGTWEGKGALHLLSEEGEPWGASQPADTGPDPHPSSYLLTFVVSRSASNSFISHLHCFNCNLSYKAQICFHVTIASNNF